MTLSPKIVSVFLAIEVFSFFLFHGTMGAPAVGTMGTCTDQQRNLITGR